jgi:tetratricopeptide (TPR) repeat protein
MISKYTQSMVRWLNFFAVPLLVATALGCVTTTEPDFEFDLDRKARTHYSTGVEYMREGKPALAIRELQTAMQISPDDPWIHWAIAEAYRQKGRPDDAERHLLRSLEIRPEFQQARLNLSALYVQVVRYEDAIEHAELLLDDPTFPVPWKALTNKGWAEYKLGRREEARRSFTLALEYNEKHWRSVLALGILDEEAGERVQALERFEQVLELSPGPLAEAEANYRIGEIYVSLGNRERALQHLTAVTAKEPNGQWGKRSADYLKRLR